MRCVARWHELRRSIADTGINFVLAVGGQNQGKSTLVSKLTGQEVPHIGHLHHTTTADIYTLRHGNDMGGLMVAMDTPASNSIASDVAEQASRLLGLLNGAARGPTSMALLHGLAPGTNCDCYLSLCAMLVRHFRQ